MKQVSFIFLLNTNTVIYKGHLSLKCREGSVSPILMQMPLVTQSFCPLHWTWMSFLENPVGSYTPLGKCPNKVTDHLVIPHLI